MTDSSAASHLSSSPPSTVLSIDPGTAKCGIAIVQRETISPNQCRALHREVAETARLVARVLSLLAAHPVVAAVLIGNATNSAPLARALRASLPDALPLHRVEEAFTSQRARVRFQIENPPRGLQRLLPPGLRTPPRPYDDYVAVLLAEDFFAGAFPDPEAPTDASVALPGNIFPAPQKP
ncbi:MAG: pre-16S rRNA-processing nuclease YqgF [Cytophagales bacterium]|nr:pre-16S rRNA-processing nuclease YqgF [Armatimonadota bacterium]